MALARSVDGHLARQSVAMEVVRHPRTKTLQQAVRVAGVDPRHVARAVLVEGGGRTLMAVLPLSYVLDFAALEILLAAPPQLLPAERAAPWFPDCEPGCVPPLPAAYGLEAVFDRALFALDHVVLEAGSRSALVRLDAVNFARLAGDATRASIAWPDDRLRLRRGAEGQDDDGVPVERLTPGSGLRTRIEAVYQLPLMPGHAHALLKLRTEADAGAADLAAVVEQDPSLAAQVLRYARSPLFGYRGRVDSVADAIARVLGYDLVLDLALGLAALKPFSIPADGPLGLDAFWQHATLSASLSQRLVRLLPAHQRPAPGTAYVCGLLHNFGYLLLGQLFQPEFYLLNRMTAANPDAAVTDLEKQLLCRGQAREVLCAGHAEVGAWVLESWGMPEPMIVAARSHHDAECSDEHGVYADLVQLADRLLKLHGIGDGAPGALPEGLLERYALEPAPLHDEIDDLLAASARADPLRGPGGG